MARRKKKFQISFEPIKNIFIFVFVFLNKIGPQLGFLILVFFGALTIQKALYADGNLIVTNLHFTADGSYLKEEVLKRLNLPQNSNLLQLNVAEISSLLERDPRIETAVVKKVFPNTLQVNLNIRQPKAWLALSKKDGQYLLDEKGYVIEFSRQSKNDGFVLIEDNSTRMTELHLGSRFFTGNTESAFELIDMIETNHYFKKGDVQAIKIDRLNSFNLLLFNDVEIRLGNRKIFQNISKLPKALRILKNEDTLLENVKYLDLQYEDIIIKKK